MPKEDRLVERLNLLLSSFGTSIPLGAERRGDGSIEVFGLGYPAIGSDTQCVVLVVELGTLDASLDPDDLHDRISEMVLQAFDVH